MLAWLGADSFGTLAATPGGVVVQFTGGGGHVDALPTSADLIHWTTPSTFSPVNSRYSVVLPTPPTATAQFYRSLLVQ